MKKSGKKYRIPQLLPKRGSFTGSAAEKKKSAAPAGCAKKQKLPENSLHRFHRIALWLSVILLIVILFFDQLVLMAIASIGSRITGCKITMENLEISFTRGDVKISNLRITAPDEADEHGMLEISSIYIKIDKSSLFSGRTAIDTLELRRVNIYGRISAGGCFNLQTPAGNLRKLIPDDQSNSTVIIRNIDLEKLQLQISDSRQLNNIDGFGIFLEHLSGTPDTGQLQFESLSIRPPYDFGRNLLILDRAEVLLAPGTTPDGQRKILSLAADSMQITAGVHNTDRPYLREVYRLFSSLFADSGEPQKSSASTPLPIGDFRLRNFSLLIQDMSSEKTAAFFGIRLKEINGNWESGAVNLDTLLITSPEGYSGNMLQLHCAQLSFVPDSLFSDTPEFNNIKINNLNVIAGIKNRDHTNIGVAVNALKQLFFPITASDDRLPATPVIDNFEIFNASVTVTDYRSKRPGNINGLGVSFKKMSGSWDKGHIALDSLSVSNPEGYSDHLLQVKTLIVDFAPQSLRCPTTLIDNIQIDSLHASAWINQNGNSNFHDVKTALELLFFPLFSNKSDIADNSKDSSDPPVLQITGYRLDNCKFTIHDARNSGNVDGVSFYFREMDYSRDPGIWHLNDFRITNPPGYSKPYIATIASISATFPAYSAAGDDFVISQLIIDGAHGCAEYNRQGELNAHHIADALCIMFEGRIPCQEESPQPPEAAVPDNPAKTKTIIQDYQLKNSSFLIWDAKTEVPIRVPLQQKETAYTIESDGGNLFESMHAQTIELGDKLAGITDAQNLLIYLLNETAGSGVDLLRKTGNSGVQIFRDVFGSILPE